MPEKKFVVVPAAGTGSRFAGGLPKQYLTIANRAVVEWALAPFLSRDDVAKIVVVHANGDTRFAELQSAKESKVATAIGGKERADSVLCGLRVLQAKDSDWVLVHDAARPCLHGDDLSRLIFELDLEEVGGLLAAPVTDSLKSADSSLHVSATVPRAGLWRALTPQMFRFGILRRALEQSAGLQITDESAAVERLGLKPKIVAGRPDNVKITVPEDLTYAEAILRSRGFK